MNPRGSMLLTFACLVFGAWSGCSPADASADRPPIPVKIHAVEKATAHESARFSGSLEPKVHVDMAFRVGGYVESLGQISSASNAAAPRGAGKGRALDKGDFVKKGTVLARVRAADYQQKVATARAAVSQARAQAKLADTELDRGRRLFDAKAITKADLDAQIARADIARAAVDAAEAQANEAGNALGDTVLVAPMDGVVLSRRVEPGTLVAPGQPAFALADMEQVKAVFGVPQTLVEKLRVGSPVTVFVEDKTLPASITHVAPSADVSGRVFIVEALLPNESHALRPGSVVSVHVPEAELGSGSMTVPLSAVARSSHNPRGYAVFVLDGAAGDSTARLRDVQLGEVLGNAVTVMAGLAPNERVVTVGATLLHDGSRVAVIP